MSTITAKDLGELGETRTGAGRVLSVYLDVDQSKPENLNRRFVSAFESRVQLIGRQFEEECELSDFLRCAADVRNLLAAYEPHGRALVVFARSTGQSWFREVNAGIATDVSSRFAVHTSGKGAKFTRANPPVKVLGARAFASRSEALKAEAALKKLDRTKRLAWARACEADLPAQ